MSYKSIIGAICACLTLITFSADAALLSRLGGLAYYDEDADLTWLADANAGASSAYDNGPSTTDGFMTWNNANDWAASLNVAGVTGWRLPDTIDVGNDGNTYANDNEYTGIDAGYNISTHSEMSNLFYNVLGNLALFDTNGNKFPTGWGLENTGPFSNVVADDYWSATEYPLFSGIAAWSFDMLFGDQHSHKKDLNLNAWAVYSGDVGTVPIPAATWLFGSGLLGLIGVARRKKV